MWSEGNQEGGPDRERVREANLRECREAKREGEFEREQTRNAMNAGVGDLGKVRWKSMYRIFLFGMFQLPSVGMSQQPILLEVKPLTGEPDAGNLQVRFGGRGDRIIRSFLPLSSAGVRIFDLVMISDLPQL